MTNTSEKHTRQWGYIMYSLNYDDMKKYLWILFLIFLVSCIGKKNYSNTTIKSRYLTFNFYTPESFILKETDTIPDNFGSKVRFQYARANDTGLVFSFSYYKTLYDSNRNMDINLVYKYYSQDFKALKDSHLSYVQLIKINGIEFVKTHHIWRDNDIAYDELISLYKKNYIVFNIRKNKYFNNDSVLYKNIRDSIFNSVMMK